MPQKSISIYHPNISLANESKNFRFEVWSRNMLQFPQQAPGGAKRSQTSPLISFFSVCVQVALEPCVGILSRGCCSRGPPTTASSCGTSVAAKDGHYCCKDTSKCLWLDLTCLNWLIWRQEQQQQLAFPLFSSPLFVFVHISLVPAVTGVTNRGLLRQRMSEQTAVDPVAQQQDFQRLISQKLSKSWRAAVAPTDPDSMIQIESIQSLPPDCYI